MDLSTVLTRSPDAAFRVYDGKATIVMPSQSKVHVMNEVGSAIWESIDGQRSLGQILEGLVDRFAIDRAQAQADLLEFASSLSAQGMVS